MSNSLCAKVWLRTGFFFGRTPLIKLSPKKTWEGFIFGFLCTVLASFVLAKCVVALTLFDEACM